MTPLKQQISFFRNALTW